MSEAEQAHIVAAYSFELSKVERQSIREREVNQILLNIDPQLAARVAATSVCSSPRRPTRHRSRSRRRR